MSSLPRTRPPVQSSGLDRLACWLAGEGYPSESISRIILYAHREGTPTGAPGLDREDEEHAEHAFVEGQEAVPGVADEWDEHYPDPGRGPVYASVGADYALDRLGWSLAQLQAALVDAREALPSISGGAPEPTATDWQEYGDTFDEIEAVDPTLPRPWRSAAELAEWTRRALRDRNGLPEWNGSFGSHGS